MTPAEHHTEYQAREKRKRAQCGSATEHPGPGRQSARITPAPITPTERHRMTGGYRNDRVDEFYMPRPEPPIPPALARLSMRRAGSRWCAYITTDSGIDDAVEIGSIPLDAVITDRECRRSFLRAMMAKARQTVEAASGIKVQFRNSDPLTR